MTEFTVVLGVDEHTLESLKVSLPTWIKNKPSLFKNRFLIFHDTTKSRLVPSIREQFQFTNANITFLPWPPRGAGYHRSNESKWTNSQRAKMLAGFCYAPLYVGTPYWLKIDLDVLALPGKDDWVKPEWFKGDPAIIAPPWGYTKPAKSMLSMDLWVQDFENDPDMKSTFAKTEPLNLVPEPGSSMVRHSRICSWCSFFNTAFSKRCARLAEATLGHGHIPIDSQDGFHWYMAKRLGYPILPCSMKHQGWKVCPNFKSTQETAKELLT